MLQKFFEVCKEKGLYLSARKCIFFTKEVKWCGRRISANGYRMDPSNGDILRSMAVPRTAEELAQFIYCCRWMRMGIPNFSERIAPLSKVLEEAYKRSGRRKNRSIKGIQLSTLSWGPAQEAVFKGLQDTLLNSVKMAYRDSDKTLCLFTNASSKYWAAVVTQTEPDQLQLPHEDQVHEALAFLGGEFNETEKRWTTFEQEAFAIFSAFDKLSYLFHGETTHVFTDHRNLLFVFAPLAMTPTLGRHAVSKVHRWALFLSRFDYILEHIDGESNVCADIMTRWSRNYRKENRQLRTVCSLIEAPIDGTVTADAIEWPDMEYIKAAQEASTSRTTDLRKNGDGVWMRRGSIWIPDDNLELKLKILTISHGGVAGHRGKEVTESVIREAFWWKSLTKDVNAFVEVCLHCMVSRGGERVPRPLGSSLHGEVPNEVVHMDFLFMGASVEKDKYILILRDDFSSYVWLWPCVAANAEAAADALSTWVGSFGSMKWIVSDQGSHFYNQLVQNLTRQFHCRHHFTTPYCPWANGSVERICREVLRGCRALLSEWRLAPTDWPAVTECLQCMLNHAPLRSLRPRREEEPREFRTPLEVFTGHKPRRPLLRALPVEKYPKCLAMDEIEL